MSKQKKKKNKKHHEIVKKKKSNKKTIIVLICVVCAIALAVAGGIIIDRMTNIKYVDFIGKTLHSTAAYDSEGKEVDLYEIYNVRYDNYRGSLQFDEDETFSMWMTPGPDYDSTGSFTFSVGDSVIEAQFNNGEKIEFKIVRDKDGNFSRIEAPYQGYTIYFTME